MAYPMCTLPFFCDETVVGPLPAGAIMAGNAKLSAVVVRTGISHDVPPTGSVSMGSAV